MKYEKEVAVLELHTNENIVGKIAAISISKKKGIPKTNVQSARLIENFELRRVCQEFYSEILLHQS